MRGMTTNTNRPGAQTFVAFEVSLQVISSLRDVVSVIRKHEPTLANQIVRSASSVAANLAEETAGKARTACTSSASQQAVPKKPELISG